MSTASDCLFCRVAAKTVPGHIVYEDDRTSAFLDIQPCSWGHTVVISKMHSAGLTELPPNEIGPLFATVQRVAARLLETLPAVGLTIGVNDGVGAGQTVAHLHVHIIPRYAGDGGGNIHSVVRQKPPEDLDATAKMVQIT